MLYYQINQFRDALDAYSRAIRLDPFLPEVWYNLGALYEGCHNQLGDAIDAYVRASEMDPTNENVKTRLALLREQQLRESSGHAAPAQPSVHHEPPPIQPVESQPESTPSLLETEAGKQNEKET